MKKDVTFAFGKSIGLKFLNSQIVSEVLEDAFEHASLASRPDIECVIDVLERVSACWLDPEYPLRVVAQKALPEMLNFSSEMVFEGLNVVGQICSRASIEKRLRGELGDLRVLDEWRPQPHNGHELKAVPRGVLLHLTAGNVFVGAVDSLVSGIITKNANILKMSRVDSLFPILFLESIKENDPEGLVWPHQAVLLWKGGDELVENLLLKAPLTVVFWGGLEALESVRSRTGAHTRLIENGPRYSFAAIEGKRLEGCQLEQTVKGLALDLCRWDQQACSSPHLVYFIDTDEALLNEFMEALYDELFDLSETLPVGRLSFDEKVEIRKVRELTRMSEAKGESRLLCPTDFLFTLVYEKDSEFRVSCLNRTLFFKRLESVDELLEKVRPLGAFLQTVGVLATPESEEIIADGMIGLGAKRVTAIGGMSEGHEGAPHEGSYLLRDLVDWVAREFRNTSENKVETLLGKILGSPYYSRIVSQTGCHGIDAFKKLPLLDRETFYRNSPPESGDILTGPMTDAYVYASGGTTGSPKFTLYSNDEYRYVTDVLTEIYSDAGLEKGDRVANLFLAGNLWTSFNVAGRALENLGCLNLPVGGGSDFENILKYLEIFKVNAVVGLPSIIVKLAEEVKKKGLPIQIEKVLYGGEHLRPQTCKFLEETLGAKLIRSAGYACVDTGPVGWQCLDLKGAIHHELDQYCYIEILDPESGQECPPGTPGEIVATNLNRVLMPVVRYKTGDLGVWFKDHECSCGFKGRSFELLGRCDDLLVVGGINLMPIDVAAGLNKLDVSPNFQIVASLKEGKEHLTVRIEAEKKLDNKRVFEALQQGSYKLEESLSEGWMVLEIEWFKPGEIPRNSRTGKLKTVVDER